MEEFEIQLLQQLLTVSPQEDGTFQIWEDGTKIGTLAPQPSAVGVEWVPNGEIGRDYAQQIGELISKREM